VYHRLRIDEDGRATPACACGGEMRPTTLRALNGWREPCGKCYDPDYSPRENVREPAHAREIEEPLEAAGLFPDAVLVAAHRGGETYHAAAVEEEDAEDGPHAMCGYRRQTYEFVEPGEARQSHRPCKKCFGYPAKLVRQTLLGEREIEIEDTSRRPAVADGGRKQS
jgi:hypothetical protein